MVNNKESERRARLMKMRDERLPDIKKQFEEAQKRHFNSNFAEGGKDAGLVKKASRGAARSAQGAKKATREMPTKGQKTTSRSARTTEGRGTAVRGKTAAQGSNNGSQGQKAVSKRAGLGVTVRKGEMVHHQRMLSQDVNMQATQHIIGVPVNKSRYNGYDGKQVTNAQLKSARPDPDAVRIIPMGVLANLVSARI